MKRKRKCGQNGNEDVWEFCILYITEYINAEWLCLALLHLMRFRRNFMNCFCHKGLNESRNDPGNVINACILLEMLRDKKIEWFGAKEYITTICKVIFGLSGNNFIKATSWLIYVIRDMVALFRKLECFKAYIMFYNLILSANRKWIFL